MTAVELLQVIEASGGVIRVDGPDLVIKPRSAVVRVREELRIHKAEVIAELARRLQVPEGAWLVKFAPLPPPIRLSECEVVVDVDLFVRTTLGQLNAQLRGKVWLAGNWGLQGLLTRLRAVGCEVVVDDDRKVVQ